VAAHEAAMASPSRKSMPTALPSQNEGKRESVGSLAKFKRATTIVKMSNAMKRNSSGSISSMVGEEKPRRRDSGRASTGAVLDAKELEERATEDRDAAFRKIVGQRQIYSIAKNVLQGESGSPPSSPESARTTQDGGFQKTRRLSFGQVARSVQMGARKALLKNRVADAFLSLGHEKAIHDKLKEILQSCMQNHDWAKLAKGLEELEHEMDKLSLKHGARVDFKAEKEQVAKALKSIAHQQKASETFSKCLTEIKALEEDVSAQPEVMWSKLMESRDLMDENTQSAEELQKAMQFLGKISEGKKKQNPEDQEGEPEHVETLFSLVPPETLYEIRDGLIQNGTHDKTIEEDVRTKFSTLGASREDLTSVLDVLRAEAWGESVQQAVKSIISLSEVSAEELCKHAVQVQERLERDHPASKPAGYRSHMRRRTTIMAFHHRASVFNRRRSSGGGSHRRESDRGRRSVESDADGSQEFPRRGSSEQKPKKSSMKRVSIFEDIIRAKDDEEKVKERRQSLHALQEEERDGRIADRTEDRRRSLYERRVSLSERRQSLAERRQSLVEKRKSILAQVQVCSETAANGSSAPEAGGTSLLEEIQKMHSKMEKQTSGGGSSRGGQSKKSASSPDEQSEAPSDVEGEDTQGGEEQDDDDGKTDGEEAMQETHEADGGSEASSARSSVEPTSPSSDNVRIDEKPSSRQSDTKKKALRSQSMVEDVANKLELRQCMPMEHGEYMRSRTPDLKKDLSKKAFDPQNVAASLFDMFDRKKPAAQRKHVTVDSDKTVLFDLSDVPGVEILMRGERLMKEKLFIGDDSPWKRLKSDKGGQMGGAGIEGVGVGPSSSRFSTGSSAFSDSEFFDFSDLDIDPAQLFPEDADDFTKRQILMMYRMRRAFASYGIVKDVYIAEVPEQRHLLALGPHTETQGRPQKKKYTGFVTFVENESAKTVLEADLSSLKIAGKGIVTVKKLEAEAVATWKEVAESSSPFNESAALAAAIHPEEEDLYKLLLSGRLSSALVELHASIVSKWGSIEKAAVALSHCGGAVGGDGRISVETLYFTLKMEKGYKRSLGEVCTLFQSLDVTCTEIATLSVEEFSRLADIKNWLNLEEQNVLLADELFGILQLRRILMDTMNPSELLLAQAQTAMANVLVTSNEMSAEATEALDFLKKTLKDCHAELNAKNESKFVEILMTRRGLQTFVDFVVSASVCNGARLEAIRVIEAAVDKYLERKDSAMISSSTPGSPSGPFRAASNSNPGSPSGVSRAASPGPKLASEHELFLAAELWRPLLSAIDPEAAEDTFGISAEDASPIEPTLLKSLMALFLRARVPSAVVGANAHLLAPHVASSLRRLHAAASEDGTEAVVSLLKAIELLEQSHEAIDSSLAGTVAEVHRMAAALGGCRILRARLSVLPRGEDIAAEKLGNRMLKAWEQERIRLFQRWPLPGAIKATELAKVDLLGKVISYAHEEEFWTQWPPRENARFEKAQDDADETDKARPDKADAELKNQTESRKSSPPRQLEAPDLRQATPSKAWETKAKAKPKKRPTQSPPRKPEAPNLKTLTRKGPKFTKPAAAETGDTDSAIEQEVLFRLNKRWEKVQKRHLPRAVCHLFNWAICVRNS